MSTPKMTPLRQKVYDFVVDHGVITTTARAGGKKAFYANLDGDKEVSVTASVKWLMEQDLLVIGDNDALLPNFPEPEAPEVVPHSDPYKPAEVPITHVTAAPGTIYEEADSEEPFWSVATYQKIAITSVLFVALLIFAGSVFG